MKKTVLFAAAACLTLAVLLFSAAAADNGPYGFGYMDRDGNIVIDLQFDYAFSFVGDRARIFTGKLSDYGSPSDGLYGYIDTAGNIVIHEIYEKAIDFSEKGYAVVCKNGKYGIIDTDGNAVVDFRYDHIAYKSPTDTYDAFVGTLSSWGSPESGTHYIIDAAGNVIFQGEYKNVYAYYDYYEVSKDNKYALFSSDGTPVTGFVYDSLTAESESVLGFKKGNLYGYIDVGGNEIIDAAFDSIGKFENGKAIVKKDGRYFLIDLSGAVLTAYKADYVYMEIINGRTYAFEGTMDSNGYCDQGYYYLMDLDGSYLSRGYKKGDCYSIDSNGIWRVKEGTLWHLVDMQGNETCAPVNCDYIYTCGEDRYVYESKGKRALADKNGNLITDYVWDRIVTTFSPLLPVQRRALEPDFRSVRWGMSENEVRALEGSFPDYSGKMDGRNARYIGYNTRLMGNDVIVAYYFGPDGLYEARYIWTEKHSNDNLYISDYGSVREQLTKKYGSPLWDQENWDTASHKNYYSDNKGNALSFGYLSYETMYITNRSYITMQMSADNYQVSFIVYYESKTISAPEEDYSDLF